MNSKHFGIEARRTLNRIRTLKPDSVEAQFWWGVYYARFLYASFRHPDPNGVYERTRRRFSLAR